MHLSDCSCAPILQFFHAALDGAQQTAKFRTAFLVIFRLDALALSVIATATWLAGWVAGCHTPVLYQNG